MVCSFVCSFFNTISSKCPSKRDEDSTSYSYISDSSVLSLHKLLWDHQEKIGTYLATKRLVADFQVSKISRYLEQKPFSLETRNK